VDELKLHGFSKSQREYLCYDHSKECFYSIKMGREPKLRAFTFERMQPRDKEEGAKELEDQLREKRNEINDELFGDSSPEREEVLEYDKST